MKTSISYTGRSRVRSKLLPLLCTFACAAPAVAQPSEIPPPPDLPPNAKLGPADLDGKFDDPGNSTAKAMAQAKAFRLERPHRD